MRDFRASFDGGKKGREARPLDAKVEEEKAKVRLLGEGEGGKAGLRNSRVTDGDGIGGGRAGESESLQKKSFTAPFPSPIFFCQFFLFLKNILYFDLRNFFPRSFSKIANLEFKGVEEILTGRCCDFLHKQETGARSYQTMEMRLHSLSLAALLLPSS